MQNAPMLDRTRLIHTLQRYYHIRVREMRFQPVGEDSYSFLLELEDSRRLFLKIYRQSLYWDAVLLIPFTLYNSVAYGDPLKAIVPPIKTAGGALKVPFDDWIMALFPYIEGRALCDTQPEPSQYTALGASLRAVHRRAENVGIPAPEETFDTSTWRESLMRMLSTLASASQSTDSYRSEAARMLAAARQDVLRLFGLFHEAAERAREVDAPQVLCHGDPTGGNVIFSAMTDKPRLVDWDGIRLAPKECDLVYFNETQLQHILKGYAGDEDVVLNQDVVAYYRRLWDVQEVVEYGVRLLLEEHHERQRAHDLAALQHALREAGIPG